MIEPHFAISDVQRRLPKINLTGGSATSNIWSGVVMQGNQISLIGGQWKQPAVIDTTGGAEVSGYWLGTSDLNTDRNRCRSRSPFGSASHC